MEKHVERICHQIAGLAHIALARNNTTKAELLAKLETIGTKITPIQLDDILRAEHPELGAREAAELFWAMDTKLTLTLAPLEIDPPQPAHE
jgi:hypothetical protein